MVFPLVLPCILAAWAGAHHARHAGRARHSTSAAAAVYDRAAARIVRLQLRISTNIGVTM